MSDEWLDLIAQCRNGKTHNYDIVEGPMADDTVWNYVNDFLTGRISRKQFLDKSFSFIGHPKVVTWLEILLRSRT